MKKKCLGKYIDILWSFRFFSPEQAVYGGGAAVDASQHVTRFAAQVPAQREGVQMSEQTHLNHAVGELLHLDPQERAHVADEAWGTWEKAKIWVKSTERNLKAHVI